MNSKPTEVKAKNIWVPERIHIILNTYIFAPLLVLTIAFGAINGIQSLPLENWIFVFPLLLAIFSVVIRCIARFKDHSGIAAPLIVIAIFVLLFLFMMGLPRPFGISIGGP